MNKTLVCFFIAGAVSLFFAGSFWGPAPKKNSVAEKRGDVSRADNFGSSQKYTADLGRKVIRVSARHDVPLSPGWGHPNEPLAADILASPQRSFVDRYIDSSSLQDTFSSDLFDNNSSPETGNPASGTDGGLIQISNDMAWFAIKAGKSLPQKSKGNDYLPRAQVTQKNEVTPEPGTMLLLGAGLAGLLVIKRNGWTVS